MGAGGNAPAAAPATAPAAAPAAPAPAQPQNLFQLAQQQQQQAQHHPAGAGVGGGPGISLDALVNNPQVQQLRDLIAQNPALAQPLIQQLAASNPQLAQLFANNPEALLQLLGGDIGGEFGDEEGAIPPGANVIHITEEEQAAIQRVCICNASRLARADYLFSWRHWASPARLLSRRTSHVIRTKSLRRITSLIAISKTRKMLDVDFEVVSLIVHACIALVFFGQIVSCTQNIMCACGLNAMLGTAKDIKDVEGVWSRARHALAVAERDLEGMPTLVSTTVSHALHGFLAIKLSQTMSTSIRAPWIHYYLVQIAEEHGGNLISLAPETKARKGQLIQVG